MLDIKNLRVELDKFRLAVDGLKINKGEFFTIIGKTGAGKTTLLETILGTRKIKEGEIWLADTNITKFKLEERNIGYVPQDYLLFCHFNVFENIAFGLRQRKIPDSEITHKVNNLADMLSISHLLNRYQCSLSGGEKLRVALARALVITPKLLLMDEPFSALDVSTKHKLWLETKTVQKYANVTTLHITHDLEEAFTLSDRIGFLSEGKLIQVGSREEIFYSPQTTQLTEFLGISNIFDGEVISIDEKALKISCNGFIIDAPLRNDVVIGNKVKFCIRPEEIKVLENNREIREALSENIFKGKIVEAIHNSTTYTLYFKANSSNGKKGFDFEVKLPIHRYQQLGLWDQKEVSVAMRKKAIVLVNG